MELKYESGEELAVKVIFGEDFDLPVRLPNAKTEETDDIPKLADSIELVESYNNFRGKDVADVLRNLHEKGLLMNARFGREGSPVLYVHPPYWTSQRSVGSNTNRKFTDEERRKIFLEIMHELKKAEPDELWMMGAESEPCDPPEAYCVRAWWD